MRFFGWLGSGDIPARYDLARLGWIAVDLMVAPGQAGMPLLTDDMTGLHRLISRRERAPFALLGIDDPQLRARLLADGFGEVLPAKIALEELEERATRVAAALDALPRRRQHGRLTLDLLLRDGWVGPKRLGLHPREFALLWRLAETPGEAISAEALLSDVWHMHFRPETNSLAVHVCRLRAKLAGAGLPQVVRTTAAACYVLAIEGTDQPGDSGALALPLPQDAGLDSHLRRPLPGPVAATHPTLPERA